MSDYCLDIVRRHDPDRFLLSLFAKRSRRSALWALFAFNYEISKTRDLVSETTIGLIRLQWWRDAITKIYEGKPTRQHIVLEPLAEAITTYNLPQDLFNDLIYAREFDLEGVVPSNLEGLLNYCNYISTPLVKLALKIVGEKDNDTLVVGIATHYALIGVIRAVPYMLKQQRIMLPQDILSENKISQESLFVFKGKEKLAQVIKEVLETKNKFRNASTSSASSKLLRKTEKLAYIYEQQITNACFDVFDPRLTIPPRFLAIRLWLRS